MTYDRATEILGLTTPKSLETNAKMASRMLGRMSVKTPLRYKVAAQIIINAG